MSEFNVPAGWKLVPCEPTPAIIAAASLAGWPNASKADIDLAREASKIVLMSMQAAPGFTLDMLAANLATMAPAYRAMIAAAPVAQPVDAPDLRVRLLSLGYSDTAIKAMGDDVSMMERAIAARSAPVDAVPGEPVAEKSDWYCETHPEHEMGHEGCGGAGVLDEARIALLANQIRLLKQEVRETAAFRDDVIRQFEAAAAAIPYEVLAEIALFFNLDYNDLIEVADNWIKAHPTAQAPAPLVGAETPGERDFALVRFPEMYAITPVEAAPMAFVDPRELGRLHASGLMRIDAWRDDSAGTRQPLYAGSPPIASAPVEGALDAYNKAVMFLQSHQKDEAERNGDPDFVPSLPADWVTCAVMTAYMRGHLHGGIKERSRAPAPQPLAPEPIGCILNGGRHAAIFERFQNLPFGQYVYARPVPAVLAEPLTDEQILMISERSLDKCHCSDSRAFYVAREVERHYNIGATPSQGSEGGEG